MARHETIPLQPNGERYTFETLCVASSEDLERVMRLGVQPKLEDLAGWEYKGYNTLDLTALLGFRKFKKGFYLPAPVEGEIRELLGYNVQVVQNPLGEPWFDRIRRGQPIRHGWYRCYPVRMTEVDCRYPNAVLINYDCPENPRLDPTRRLRDYVVQLYPEDPTLLLGKAYVALAGPLRVAVSYFALGRSNPSPLHYEMVDGKDRS